MGKKILIDAKQPEETRVVLLNGNRIEDFDQETKTKLKKTSCFNDFACLGTAHVSVTLTSP